jgi:hypothetical protein
VLHQIGVGALGPVFRTYEPTRDRLVAVKVFRLDITPEQSQSLADELAKAAEAGLFHPSIVEPIASGIEGTVAYRAEEYVAAESLDVAMRHYAPAPAEKVLPFITQLAGAIDFARTAGIGHGALHPRDVFLTPEEARATGFGVVEALERVGLRAPVRRPYSAPERVSGNSWSTPADVFSLAAIAYEMLTSRRPAGTGAQIGAVGGDHGGALHAVLARGMADDPADRYPTALAFAAAVEAASRGVVVLDDQVEESVAAMPPLVNFDEHEEPVQAEQEEVAFRTEEPEFDDIAAERDEDAAHFALGVDEPHEPQRPVGADDDDDPFDSEGVEDLALDAPDVKADTGAAAVDRFAGEFAFVADQTEVRRQDDLFERVSPDQRLPEEAVVIEEDDDDLRHSDTTLLPAAAERTRSAMLPNALWLIVGLLIGFAAGHVVGGRDTGAPVETTASHPAGAVPSPQAADPAGKAYSEETVSRPRTPETVPPAGGEARPAGRPAPPATVRGRLVVQSTPAGAGVTLNGRWGGRTPLSVDDLPLRRYTVRVVQPGYLAAREEVTLSSDSSSRTLTFRLQRARAAAAPPPVSGPGSIYVDSRPRGARVFLDGTAIGATPLRIAASSGSHTVRLELANHSPWSTRVVVRAGQQAPVTGSLERIR